MGKSWNMIYNVHGFKTINFSLLMKELSFSCLRCDTRQLWGLYQLGKILYPCQNGEDQILKIYISKTGINMVPRMFDWFSILNTSNVRKLCVCYILPTSIAEMLIHVHNTPRIHRDCPSQLVPQNIPKQYPWSMSIGHGHEDTPEIDKMSEIDKAFVRMKAA